MIDESQVESPQTRFPAELPSEEAAPELGEIIGDLAVAIGVEEAAEHFEH